jgi:hypothetical protein
MSKREKSGVDALSSVQQAIEAHVAGAGGMVAGSG